MKTKRLPPVFMKIVILSFYVATINCTKLVYADTLSDAYERINKTLEEESKLSFGERRQLATELTCNINQNPKSQAKGQAYLLATNLYLSCREYNKAEQISKQALNSEDIGLYYKVRLHTALGNAFLFSGDDEGALQQFNTACGLASEILHSNKLSTITFLSDIKPSGQLIVDCYERAVEDKARFWRKKKQFNKMMTARDSFAQDILSITSSDENFRNYIIRAATKNWIVAGFNLQRNKYTHNAHELYQKSLGILEKIGGSSELLERVRFQIACCVTLTGETTPETTSQKVNQLIEANKEKPWLIEEFLGLSYTIDPLERYGYLSKLISICDDNLKYGGIADLYYQFANNAKILGINNIATIYFEELLRKFPDYHKLELAQFKLNLVRRRHNELLEDQLKMLDVLLTDKPSKQSTQNARSTTNLAEKSKNLTGIGNGHVLKPNKVANTKIIQNVREQKQVSLDLVKSKSLLWCTGLIFVIIPLIITVRCYHRKKKRHDLPNNS